MLQAMLDLDDIKPDGQRRLSRREYDELVKLGVFEDEKIELLRGMLVTMSPEGWQHADVGVWLTRRLNRGLDDTYEVRSAHPFAATEDSEPEPDLLIGRAQPGRRAHPSEALLVVEVSASSIRKDRKAKQAIYAEAGVPEYWIIDLTDESNPVVEVYTDPTATGYASMAKLRDGDVLRPLHVPIEIAVADLPR